MSSVDKCNLAAADSIAELMAMLLKDPAHAFSLGVQGALAEFMRSEDEPWEYRERGAWRQLVTRRGAIAVDCGQPLRMVAREFSSTGSGGWRQALGLCLAASPAKRLGRAVITELGLDREALSHRTTTTRLFDLGLGIAHVDVCISSADDALIKVLRAYQGKALFAPGSPLLGELVKASPRRVFMTAAARIEVDTPIPLDHSPSGPHTHLLPEILGRPDPDACCPSPDQVCILNIHPAHPCHDQQGHTIDFDVRRHVDFQALLQRYGLKDYLEYKQQVLAILEAGGGPEQLPKATDATQRTAARLTLRQAIAAARLPRSLLAHWQSVLESAGQ